MKYTSVEAPRIKQNTIRWWLWQLDVFRFKNTLVKTLTLAISRNRKPKPDVPPWLVEFRARLKVGDLVEFRPADKWMRRKVAELTDTTVRFKDHAVARDAVYPAHGTEEWTQGEDYYGHD